VEFVSAGSVFDAVDTLEAEVATRLRAIADARAAAHAFAASCLSDHERHRSQRGELRRRLRLGNGTAMGREVKNPLSLEALRKAQENLVYAHAEGLPALQDARAVHTLAGHMVDLSRQLTVVEIWLDAEAPRE
jgi:Xaa-Pro aminopeptidase